MSGRYNGLQARIKQLNKFAEYVSCFAHSLNLVGKCNAECCEEANIFCAFVKNIYTFFSASTNRWSLLTAALSNVDQTLTIKHMSETRWSASADSTKALFSRYSDPSLYRALPIAASLLRGIFYSTFFTVNPDLQPVLQHRSLNYYSYL